MLTDAVTVLTAQSANATTSSAIGVEGYDRVGWVVITSAGVSAGVVAIEWANSFDYAGTWANLDSITVAAASTVYGTSQDHIGGFVRARISTAITGGTITAVIKRSSLSHY